MIAASAVVLGVSLFLPWYGATITIFDHTGSGTLTGWESLTRLDVMLMALAVLAILVVLRAADLRSVSEGLFGEGLLTPIALIVSIVVLVRVLSLPSEFDDREVGAWLGLFSTIGILVGSLVGMRNEWVGSRPVPPIETLPAPPAGEGAPT